MSKDSLLTKRERTRALILQTAAAQFAKAGYSGVSMATLASACKLTKGALYDHFNGKSDIYTQCVSHYVKQGMDHTYAESLTDKDAEPRARLLSFMGHFLTRLRDDLVFRRLLQRLLIDSDQLDMIAVTEYSLLSPFHYVVDLLVEYRPELDAKNHIYAFFCSAILGEDLRSVAEYLSPEIKSMPTAESALAYFAATIDQ